MPTDQLARLALRQALEQPHAVATGVQTIEVVEDDRPVPLMPELAKESEDRRVALQPAGLAAQGLPHDSAFAQAVAADQNQQIKIAAGEGLNDPLQLGIGSHTNA